MGKVVSITVISPNAWYLSRSSTWCRTHDGKYAKCTSSLLLRQQSAGCLTFEYVYQGDAVAVWQRPLPQVLRAQETALGLRCGGWGSTLGVQAHSIRARQRPHAVERCSGEGRDDDVDSAVH